MTEYEYLDLAGTYGGLGVSALMGYFSVLSAYFIVAYVVGSFMTRAQVRAVTGLYLGMQLFLAWGTVTYFWGARGFRELSGEYQPPVAPHLIALPLLVIGVIAGLKFMRDVRHPKTE
jgi:hypothetical protein